MSLEVGARLGHYTVDALIGEGGMGEVYQATDTKLNRQVALKILPEAFASDPDRLARFQREAQVLASLNHPGIAQIHGLEEEGGVKALVLELVEGPTLADRIAQGPIPVDEALPIAKQIAEALEAAHEQGVIHRDLKPANIKLKPDGTVKVLDFGLAKALDTTPEGDPSQSPTLTAAATQMGVIMGTAAYMSPEQARGKVVDKRADIWAFGVVLFEMLTGTRAFEGDDVSLTLSAVLQRDPDWEALPANVSVGLDTYLRRCLQKDPVQRVQSIGDVRLAVSGAYDPPSPPHQLSAVQPSGRRLALALGLAVGAVVAGLAVWMLTPAAPRPIARFTITAPPSDRLFYDSVGPNIALSADARTPVYAATRDGVRQLYRRNLDQLDPVVVPGTEDARSPFLSPNGEFVGFVVDGALRRVALAGGPAATLYDGPEYVTQATWGSNDTIVFSIRSSSPAGIMQVPAAGGVAEPITSPDQDPEASGHRFPTMLPNGNALLFTEWSGRPDESNIVVQSLDTGARKMLLKGSSPQFLATGHIVFARENALWAAPFDIDRLEVTGDAAPVIEGVQIVSRTGLAAFSLAADGSLAYMPSTALEEERTLVWVDRQGNEEPVDAAPGPYFALRLSPDGSHVALQIDDAENMDLVVYDLDRDTPTGLTFHPEFDAYPVWTPDGERVVFSSGRDGATDLYSRAADGTGAVQRLTTLGYTIVPSSFSPDGRLLLVAGIPADGFVDVGVLTMDAEASDPEWLLTTESYEGYPEMSPDGRWLAYLVYESGRPEIYVRPFPRVDDTRWRITRDGGLFPAWSPNGGELFYQSFQPDAPAVGGGRASGYREQSISVMSVPFETEPTFRPGDASVVVEGPFRPGVINSPRPFDISRDGERFLMIKEAASEGPLAGHAIVFVQNWLEELKARVPVP